MRNRESLLGRARPGERLSKQDREALDQATDQAVQKTLPQPQPAPKAPSVAKDKPSEIPSKAGKDASIPKGSLKYHWTAECPSCGFKVSGSGDPKVGQRLARCGRCKLNLFLRGK